MKAPHETDPESGDRATEGADPVIAAETNGACNRPPRGSLTWFEETLRSADPKSPLPVAIVFGEEVLRAAAELDASGADVSTWQSVKALVKRAGANFQDWERAVKTRRERSEGQPPPAPASPRSARDHEHPEEQNVWAEGDPEPDIDGDPVPDAKGWEARLVRTKEGELASHVSNAVTILRNDINWRGVLAFDVFLQQIVFRREPVWYADDAPTTAIDVLDDDGEIRLCAWLFRRYRLALNKDTTAQAAHIVAKGAAFDSLVDYLDGLTWDGSARLGSWLTTYLGAPDTPYTRLVGSWFLISAVARGYRPGEQVDHALILEGDQSEGKSSIVRALFGDMFSESPIDLANKDKFITIQGIWCQSFDELAGLLRSENEPAKNFITATEDRYRPPYGRHAVKVKRRCVFAGTVNPGGVGYLKDPTGNRRYWPVACGVMGSIDREALLRDREQLFAEAVHAFKAGAKWWPSTTDEKALCRQEQELRQEDTPLDETVGKWLNGHPIDCRLCGGSGSLGRGQDCSACLGTGKAKPHKPSTDVKGRRYVTQTDVLKDCLQVPDKEHNRHSSTIAATLARLGWKRPPGQYRPRRQGVQVTAYYHPQDLADEGERAAIEGTIPFAAE